MNDDFLLEQFADFYQEVADIKLAIREGRLAAYLARDISVPNVEPETPVTDSATIETTEASAPPPAADSKTPDLRLNDPLEMAAMISSRLRNRLQRQMRNVRDTTTEAEQKAFRMAQYVMAALADELFILEVQWEGRDAWLHYLLERSLFRTSSAGRDFFAYAEQLLKSRSRNDLHADLAAVFLIALQLGFRGQYRGSHHDAALADVRERLLRFVQTFRQPTPGAPAFQQAYEHHLSSENQVRLAPLARWYRAGAIALTIYLVVSTIVWITAIQPFTRAFGEG